MCNATWQIMRSRDTILISHTTRHCLVTAALWQKAEQGKHKKRISPEGKSS